MMRSIALMISLLALMACSEQSQQSDGTGNETTELTNEQRRTNIAEMEGDLNKMLGENNEKLMKPLAERLLISYKDYITVNPRDSITAEYLFKSADLSLGVGKPEASIRYLDRLIEDFPEFRKIAEMMLFRGFVYEAHINSHAQAVEAYQEMIDRFPNHRLTKDAQAAIMNLSMSEEELLEKLKAQGALSDQAAQEEATNQ